MGGQTMKTIKGLPINVEIDSDAALKETERLMLRASESKNLSPMDEWNLLKEYKEARRQWLDSHYELNDEHLQALQSADDRIIAAVMDTIDIVTRTFESEVSLPTDEQMISGAYVHLEEEGLPIEYNSVHEMTDEEINLWDLLFSEDERTAYTHWGFTLRHVSISYYNEWKTDCLKLLEKTSEHNLSKLFWQVRDRYNVALQDMARISEFNLTIDYEMR